MARCTRHNIMPLGLGEKKNKQWWSTIPPISTKWTITSHIKSWNIKKRTQPIEIMALWIMVVAWDKHTNSAEWSRLMGSPLNHSICNGTKQTIEKACKDSLTIYKSFYFVLICVSTVVINILKIIGFCDNSVSSVNTNSDYKKALKIIIIMLI